VPLANSGTALFAGSAEEFVEMAPASRLTAHLVSEFNRKGLEPDRVKELLRHTYRVLLTRETRRTYVHSTDAETQAMLKSLVSSRDARKRASRSRRAR
jgi:hypothetical protein